MFVENVIVITVQTRRKREQVKYLFRWNKSTSEQLHDYSAPIANEIFRVDFSGISSIGWIFKMKF